MPSATFKNLSKAKRERFIQACLEEFSLQPFENASISGIVKKLGIAKGSVYQYFEDKKDLYDYLISLAQERKQQIMGKVMDQNDEELHISFMRLCLAEIKFSEEFPELHSILENDGYGYEERAAQQLLILRKNIDRFSGKLVPALDRGKLAFIMKATKDAMVKQYWPQQNISDRASLVSKEVLEAQVKYLKDEAKLGGYLSGAEVTSVTFSNPLFWPNE